MIVLRHTLRLLPALLLALLFASAPAAAETHAWTDATHSVADGSAQAPRLVDHASRKLRHTASLEEFFEIDDDAEQDFKPQAGPARYDISSALIAAAFAYSTRCLPPVHRACAFFATGPPHA